VLLAHEQGAPYLIYITGVVSVGRGFDPTAPANVSDSTNGNTAACDEDNLDLVCLPQPATLGNTFLSGALNEDPGYTTLSLLNLTDSTGLLVMAPRSVTCISRLVRRINAGYQRWKTASHCLEGVLISCWSLPAMQVLTGLVALPANSTAGSYTSALPLWAFTFNR
jgi:hypothetical protein